MLSDHRVAAVELRTLNGKQVAVVRLKDAWEEAEHPRDTRGRFAKKPGGGGLSSWESLKESIGLPVNVGSDVGRAAELLGEGHAVRLDQPSTASTLLDRLAKIAKESEARGDKAKTYDLCKVSVKKTNLFCEESKGIPRVKMPQLKGKPLPGSKADKLPRDERGEVDLGPEFLKYLQAHGIQTLHGKVKAANLRATQRELDGKKVAGITQFLRGGGKIEGKPIWVSRDNYVVDGHHRWASEVAIDSEDNALGDIQMDVQKADAPIPVVLAYAKQFGREYGLPQVGIGKQIPNDRDHMDAEMISGMMEPDEAPLLPKRRLETQVDSVLRRLEKSAGLPEGQGSAFERLQVYLSWLHDQREEYFSSTYEEPTGNLALLKRLAELNDAEPADEVQRPRGLKKVLQLFGDHEATLFDAADYVGHVIGFPTLPFPGGAHGIAVELRELNGRQVAVVRRVKDYDPNEPRDRRGRWSKVPGGAISEFEAIKFYQQGFSSPVNHMLRGWDPTEQPWLGFQVMSEENIRKAKQLVPALDNAIAHGGKTPREVYRGVDLLDAPGLEDKLHKGNTFTDPGFLSTSGNEVIADSFDGRTRAEGGDPIVMKITVPEGTKSMDPGGPEHEAEHVLARGGTFNVTSEPYDESYFGVSIHAVDVTWSPPRGH